MPTCTPCLRACLCACMSTHMCIWPPPESSLAISVGSSACSSSESVSCCTEDSPPSIPRSFFWSIGRVLVRRQGGACIAQQRQIHPLKGKPPESGREGCATSETHVSAVPARIHGMPAGARGCASATGFQAIRKCAATQIGDGTRLSCGRTGAGRRTVQRTHPIGHPALMWHLA